MPSQADAHVEAQTALAARLVPIAAAAVAEVDPSDVAASVRRTASVVAGMRLRYGRASQALALASFRRMRREAGLPSSVRLDLPKVETVNVTSAVQWAFSGLYGPLNDVPTTIEGKSYAPIQQRLADAETKLTGVVDKFVMDEGRAATLSFVEQDRKARGWARVPEPDCCAWCALLSTRGAVYKEDTIKFNAGGKFVDTDEFGAHDHCRCQPLPVWGRYEKSAQILEWETLYADSVERRMTERPVSRQTSEPLSGLALFRQMYDSRYGQPSA